MVVRKSREENVVRSVRWERRHLEVLDAAAATFADLGYLGASTTDIADRLGIKAASLYYYVASKEAALAKVCEIGIMPMIERLDATLASAQPARAKIREAIANQLAPLRRLPDAYYMRVFLRHRYSLTGAQRRHVIGLSRHYQAQVGQIFADGIHSGELDPAIDPEVASFALIGLCNAVIAGRTLPKGATIATLIDAFSAIMSDGVATDMPDTRGNDRLAARLSVRVSQPTASRRSRR